MIALPPAFYPPPIIKLSLKKVNGFRIAYKLGFIGNGAVAMEALAASAAVVLPFEVAVTAGATGASTALGFLLKVAKKRTVIERRGWNKTIVVPLRANEHKRGIGGFVDKMDVAVNGGEPWFCKPCGVCLQTGRYSEALPKKKI
uniref:Uncharacterized protein n=1 Tax=Panagrolaimus sp. JU765 TaxID=591449 RepID=A0AC34RIY2_9BILA